MLASGKAEAWSVRYRNDDLGYLECWAREAKAIGVLKVIRSWRIY